MSVPGKIVRAAIHPGIGIARVGNSANGYFIGPEIPAAAPVPEGGYKDGAGAIKRQAARFRIYGFDADGNVVQEITAADAEIEWTVHVANTKASWYNFTGPLDIPEATPVGRRNPDFTGDERKLLEIDPGPRRITGINASGAQYRFDTGCFLHQPVYLGELRTDEAGRLLFLGGHGLACTPSRVNTITTYADNRGWHDDISDGPVQAEVRIQGEKIPVDPAWVVAAPPNYAPDIISIRTMYDVMVDTYQGWWLPRSGEVSFQKDILPILERFCGMQWVNFGFFLQFGWGGPYDFQRQGYMAKLCSPRPEFREVRQQVFNLFRNPNATDLQQTAWPQMYGDYVQIPPAAPLSLLSLTPTQYAQMQAWAAGKFKNDWNPDYQPPKFLDDVPLAQQPATLDEAAMHYCLGGPFHPGCEMTWPMRQHTMYYAPFRLRPKWHDAPTFDYGDTLTPEVALGENGPLYSNGAGDVTKWMATPWQSDTAGCRSGYTPEYDPFLPTFWPARVPNHVLTAADFEKIFNGELSADKKMELFNTRANWLRLLKGTGVLDQMQEMTQVWPHAGIVVRREVPHPDPQLPSVMFVEEAAAFHQRPRTQNLTASPDGRAPHRKQARAAAGGK